MKWCQTQQRGDCGAEEEYANGRVSSAVVHVVADSPLRSISDAEASGTPLRVGIDFKTPPPSPPIQHQPAVFTLSSCHCGQRRASDIQPAAPFVSRLAPKTEDALPNNTGHAPDMMPLLKVTQRGHIS